MRIGIFGGTFDPIHLGHLILAELAREQGKLDLVWFVPAGNNPFKPDRFKSFDVRAEMVELAIAGNPAFQVNRVEKELLTEFRRQHPNDPLPATYTFETIEELHRRSPDDEFFLLIGSDALNELPTWREPRRILRHAGLLLMVRPGVPAIAVEKLRAELKLNEDESLRLERMDAPEISIASKDLRSRVATGRTIRYLVPRAVEMFIRERGLYRS